MIHLSDLLIYLFFLPQSIRSALVSTILPATSTCSLISAKVSFRRGDNDTRLSTKLDDQWLKICNKRDECDQALQKIQGLAFFFSAISTIESRVDKDKIERESLMKTTKSRKRKLKVLSIGLQFPIGLPFSRQPSRVFQQCPFTLFCWTLKWKSMQKYYQNAKREKRKNQPHPYVRPSTITTITFCRKKSIFHFLKG